MYSWLKHLKSCFHVPCHAYTLLLNWRINTDDDAENESYNKVQWYLRLRREGRNQLMESQEQMPFMFLVMHTLPEMKDLKQRKTEVTIHHAAKKEWIWWAEKGGINKLCIVSQHVKSICQDDQLLRLQLRNDSSPFSDSIAPFRFGGWPTINVDKINR